MKELALKVFISSMWYGISRLFDEEIRNKILKGIVVLMDVDVPGAMKIDMLQKFGRGLLGEAGTLLASVLTILITTAFSMVVSNGKGWVEKQVGGVIESPDDILNSIMQGSGHG